MATIHIYTVDGVPDDLGYVIRVCLLRVCLLEDLVDGKERIGEGTPTPYRLGDYTGRSPFRGWYHDLDSSLGVVRNREGAGGEDMTDPHRWRMGMELGCGLRFKSRSNE